MTFFLNWAKPNEPEIRYPISLGNVMISSDITSTSQIVVRVQTALITNNNYDFIEQLANIGIEVLAYNERAATVLLPVGWTHIGESRLIEHVIDNFGRRRLTTIIESENPVTGITKLLPRFTFCVDKLERDVDDLGTELLFLAVSLIDNGKVIEQKIFDAETCKALLMNVYGNDKNLLFEKVITESFNAISEQYPGFDNPINYW